jgi:hypothetical protein
MTAQLRLEVDLSHYCGSCQLAPVCAPRDSLPCQPRFGDSDYGGPNVLHPARPDLDDYLREVGGAGFKDISVLPNNLPKPSLVTPRLRARRALCGLLDRPFYAVGPDQVIAGRRSVLTANDLREMLDMQSDQRIALTLFGADPLMEILWARRHQIVHQIAEANYDLVAPPSFSSRINHPPAEFLYNLKRSMVFFSMLQWAGVPTLPRLAWLCDADAERVAGWCNSQAHLQMVTIDLAIKRPEEWQRQVRLLQRFDGLTNRRLDFFIHGPAAEARLNELFSTLGNRLYLTGSRAISRPRASAADYTIYVEEEVRSALRALTRSRGSSGGLFLTAAPGPGVSESNPRTSTEQDLAA